MPELQWEIRKNQYGQEYKIADLKPHMVNANQFKRVVVEHRVSGYTVRVIIKNTNVERSMLVRHDILAGKTEEERVEFFLKFANSVLNG